jgi:hypothetical protein
MGMHRNMATSDADEIMTDSDDDETEATKPTKAQGEQPDQPGDGEDVARDPDIIQREIEQTRAELADTIDALADRISPKRAASRGAKAVKEQVTSVFSGGSDEAPASVLDASPEAAAQDRGAGVRAVAASGGAQFTGTTEYGVSRTLRTDRVLLVVGAAAAVAALIVLRRSRS